MPENEIPPVIRGDIYFGASVHNQPQTRGRNYKKEEPQLRELRVEVLDMGPTLKMEPVL